MNGELIIPAVVAGLLNGAAMLLPTLAVALIYEHGRYVPLWVPDLGMLGAFVAHAAWTHGAPGAVAVPCALLVTSLLACMIHSLLIARFLRSKDYLSPLLVGLGLSQVFQGVASFYGHGMSQHYPVSGWGGAMFSGSLGISVYRVDVGCVVITAMAMLLLHLFLRYMHLGWQVRAVISNSDWAQSLALPVRTVEGVIMVVAAVLVTSGTILRGIRFDLQPAMVFYPGLSAIVACIVAGPGRRITAIVAILSIETMAGLVGIVPLLSPLQRAIPFVCLLIFLIGRTCVRARQRPDVAITQP
jgi:branched-chain amino acid transport system permease protein